MDIWDLFTERHNGDRKLSLGRVSFWMLFMVILYKVITTGILDSGVLGMAALLLAYGGFKKTHWVKTDEVQEATAQLNRIIASKKERCTECGQIDEGQTGEYPCPACGLPTVHDENINTTGN